MQNQTEDSEGPQTAVLADEKSLLIDGQALVLPAHGDDFAPLTADEVEEIKRALRSGEPTDLTVRGVRLLFVGDWNTHVGLMDHLALAEMGTVLILPDVHIARLAEPRVSLDEMVLRMKAPEVLIDADFDGGEQRKGKGKRRKPWESPYGNPTGQHNGGQNHRNIQRMLPRRGGR
jgi:hypothetical protein